jgi:hypothetical protein
MKKRKKLLSVNVDAKTSKGVKMGYLTGIQYLAPSKLSGKDLCVSASPSCRRDCLNSAGRGRFSNVQIARLNKTRFFLDYRDEYFESLIWDIHALERKAKRENLIPCVRLNGTSDIMYERLQHDGANIMQHFPSMIFYDYTKHFLRTFDDRRDTSWPIPDNYHLTFSRSEVNQDHCLALSVRHPNVNVAVVFSGALPGRYMGRTVFNADESDLRFLDPPGVIVGLKAKGKAKVDSSGFVVENK